MSMNKILKEQIELIKPSKETIEKIEITCKKFSKDLREKLKKNRIGAEVFVGGSIAKGTLTKKDEYDVDVFVRFDKSYKDDEISELLGKILENANKIHGSRDYYKLIINDIIFEIIPVIKIKNQMMPET
ncbi:hypothetical protein GF386_03605 [Candidatus Pacearchaeota archaeon]|nr:hypothetical protein [Candidatus Pacearchaeota archaeon]MBD3283237.1 hypothetical protein [Candidatus Pacearchaeota archaeon]